jgi:hypothetical protein
MVWVLESRLSRDQRLFGSCVSETRIGETGLIYILPGFKVFRLPRFFEEEWFGLQVASFFDPPKKYLDKAVRKG